MFVPERSSFSSVYFFVHLFITTQIMLLQSLRFCYNFEKFNCPAIWQIEEKNSTTIIIIRNSSNSSGFRKVEGMLPRKMFRNSVLTSTKFYSRREGEREREIHIWNLYYNFVIADRIERELRLRKFPSLRF